jgi:hypothetical protein
MVEWKEVNTMPVYGEGILKELDTIGIAYDIYDGVKTAKSEDKTADEPFIQVKFHNQDLTTLESAVNAYLNDGAYLRALSRARSEGKERKARASKIENLTKRT